MKYGIILTNKKFKPDYEWIFDNKDKKIYVKIINEYKTGWGHIEILNKDLKYKGDVPVNVNVSWPIEFNCIGYVDENEVEDYLMVSNI